jgi:Fur family ferric uptake transcriptional regulator
VPVAEPPVAKFAEYLEIHGQRLTKPRRELVEHIFSYHEHFTADDLVFDVREKKISVGRATIYRTLDLLVEAGMLRKLRFADRDAYEHDYGYPDHDHIYCTKCKRIIEFHNEDLVELRERLAREHQFHGTSHRFVISGLCESCFRAKGTKHKLDFV